MVFIFPVQGTRGSMNPNTWAMACHLCGLIGYLGNPLGSIVGPLVVWIIKKDALPQVDLHGKEALNFNISVTLYALVLGAVASCLGAVTLGVAAIITVPLIVALIVFHLFCVISAAIKANQGEMYKYPCCIRLLK